MVNNNKIFKYFIIAFTSLFLGIWLFIYYSFEVSAEEFNSPFAVENMLPGDVVTKDYTIKVSHKNPIDVYHRIDVLEGYEKLAEVLDVKVELPEKNIVLYEGLMKDMQNPVIYKYAAGEKEVVYRISVSLDTSVGNEYQYKSLQADFRWWYAEEAEEKPNDSEASNTPEDSAPVDKIEVPTTGDRSNINCYLLICILSAFGILRLKQNNNG